MILDKEKSERGSAFILALMLVAAVGLLVVPVMYLATTGLRSTNAAQQRFLERYAADAGVEQGIWHVQYDPNYKPTPDEWFTYYSTFNNQQVTVDIIPAGVPTPMYTPTPIPPVTSGSASNMLPDTTVDPNIVAPCSAPCPVTTITYILYLHNFGSSSEIVKGIGVCLPVGFQYLEMVEDPYWNSYGVWMLGGIENLYWNSSGDPFDVTNSEATPTFNVGETDPPCGDPAGPGVRQQVKWLFPPGRPGRLRLSGDTRASITFRATAILGGPALHYDDAWIESTNILVSREQLSPVVVKWGQFDIRSTAGGTSVEARTTLYGDTNETYIDSWQVSD